MIYELVGARMIAPYLGTSLYVWTAVIGVILGALSLGYYFGGRAADAKAETAILVRIFILAAALMAAGLVIQVPVLQWLSSSGTDLRFQAFIAALLLFASPVVFLGMVSPYLAKLKLTNLKTAGQKIGGLYAAGTVGSILGTFLAGYWLISYVGSQSLGWLLVAGVLGISFLADVRQQLPTRLALLATLVVVFTLSLTSSAVTGASDVVYDGDSAYSRYQVLARQYHGQAAHLLIMDNEGIQSGVSLARPHDPLFEYAKRFVEAAQVYGQPQDILMVGGGTFTVPSQLAYRFPNARIDIVEIDPKLTQLAQDYFSFQPTENTRVINQDGRVYLNQNQKKYDIVFMDAYSAITPPFQLTTVQAVQRIADSLKPGGIIVANAIATPEGPQSAYATSQLATYQAVLENVRWRKVAVDRANDVRQNVILVAGDTDNALRVDGRLGGEPLSLPNEPTAKLLTDDFAPIERLTSNY